MKRFFMLFALNPVAGYAHGAHPPVSDAVHSVSHAAPLIGMAVIVAAAALALHRRFLS